MAVWDQSMSLPSVPRLVVRNLGKRYGKIEAVRDVSFEVGPGEIFGLLGPNGAGKTSVIECLLGLRTADAGTVMLDQTDLLQDPVRARGQIGAVLQFAALQDKITPTEALQTFGAFYRSSLPADALLRQFSLEDKANAPFDSLSGGQKQRLFLALALINQPRLLVLDEPTAGLDPASRRELQDTIRQLKAGGHSVLLSTHYLEEAHQLCDRIGIIYAGQLVAVDRPDALIARAKTQPQLKFRTAKPLSAESAGQLSSVTRHQKADDGWTVQTSDVNRTVSSLVQILQNNDNELLDFQIRRPSLEDVFLELTHSPWSEVS